WRYLQEIEKLSANNNRTTFAISSYALVKPIIKNKINRIFISHHNYNLSVIKTLRNNTQDSFDIDNSNDTDNSNKSEIYSRYFRNFIAHQNIDEIYENHLSVHDEWEIIISLLNDLSLCEQHLSDRQLLGKIVEIL